MKTVRLKTDILIVGGGAAGAYAGITLGESDRDVIVVDKGNIVRSGCLAAGVNALNAYINEGQTEEDYLDYIKKEFKNVVREDLVYSIAKRLNHVTKKIEDLGLPILKDKEGNYVPRGKRSIKINGEYIKPLLYKALKENENIRLLEKVNICDYIVKSGKVIGVYGFSIVKDEFYVIESAATICATGGASGIYRPNNPGHSRHKMWYSPFNTGAGYAMGIRAGAEMTSLEMRFMALRCKDTIAPTGTIAQGISVDHVNSRGDSYTVKARSTADRLSMTIAENENGRGPCYLKTIGMDREKEEQLYKAYLNMAPAQALKWFEQNGGPSDENVEIEGTEPYITGGHSGAGYWIDKKRATTLRGLFASGDVAGGSPKKYVTGCFAEGEIAAQSALKYIKDDYKNERLDRDEELVYKKKLLVYFANNSVYSIEEAEETLQKIMDEYAGGIYSNYKYDESRLNIALKKIDELQTVVNSLRANDNHELLFIQEIRDRIIVSKVLIYHMLSRKESRWKPYQRNMTYDFESDEYGKYYINSEYIDGKVGIKKRSLIKSGDIYEHSYR